MSLLKACLAVLLLALNVAGHPYGYNPEYHNLGCPDSTKPYASKSQQLEAITDFGNLLYIQKEVEKAEYTYVAEDFINHAPMVPGNGRDLAMKLLIPRLESSTVEVKNVWMGQNATGSDFSMTYFKGISSEFGVGVIADIWRMIGTCLVEHWDVAAPVLNSSNPLAYF